MGSIRQFVVVFLFDFLAIAALAGCAGFAEQPTISKPSLSSGGSKTAATELSALITQVDGDVIVSYEAGDTDNGNHGRLQFPARSMQVLRSGAALQIPQGASVGLICAGDQWLELHGEQEWLLTEAACSQGRAQSPGTYQRLIPQAGRLRVNDFGTVLELKTRENPADYGKIPVILSPRETRLLELELPLSWVEVPEAVEYVLSMSGSTNNFPDITVKLEDLTCQADGMNTHQVCSMDWPAAEWQLSRGQRYFLKVSALTNIAEPPSPSEESALRTVPEEEAARIRAAVDEIDNSGMGQTTRDLLLANLYAEQELFDDAIAAYQRVVEEQPAAELYVTLGDIFSHLGLSRQAFAAYVSALETPGSGANDSAVRAASEFGIGRLYYNDQNYREAREHFKLALDLYEQLDTKEEREAAQHGWEAANDR